ncbi:methylated-DNA--[protein]-cysteine S-methyltransferase [Streptomyces sp. NPDC047108]|uniref:methylated-DNA--[protein]-cysteine S-methyltransferase n=1 Tax=Streptomyces sp. NPDC047108 TaxID=3155025 RepID=UPI0033E3162D
MTVYTTIDSPLGELLLVGEESATAKGGTALASVSVPGQKGGALIGDGRRHDPAAFAQITAQFRAYFDGRLTAFDIEHTTRGTDFQQRVWKALEEIPYGATTSYGALAASIGASRAAVRAVGTAIGANPLLVVRPCHRVIGADGSLTGYAGGLERKRTLLDLEGALPAGPAVTPSPAARRPAAGSTVAGATVEAS